MAWTKAWRKSWPWSSSALFDWWGRQVGGKGYNLVPLPPTPTPGFQGLQWDAQGRAKNSEFAHWGATWEGQAYLQGSHQADRTSFRG